MALGRYGFSGSGGGGGTRFAPGGPITKGAGRVEATHVVSGDCGVFRNDLTTLCAQGDPNTAPCPTPGIVMTLEFESCRAAMGPNCAPVLPSKPPETTSVGIELRVAVREERGALGTFQ